MLKVLRVIALLLLYTAFGTPKAAATHIAGGYISYRHLGQHSTNGKEIYQVRVNLYRDCRQGSETPAFTKSIFVGVYNNDGNKTFYRSFEIFPTVIEQRIEPPGFADCNYDQLNYCLDYAVYQGTIQLDKSVTGYWLHYELCCRNAQNNLAKDGSNFQGQTFQTLIPNTNLNNSSPMFDNIPSPYMCANDTTNILYSAFDPDGDSLVFEPYRPYASYVKQPMWSPPTDYKPDPRQLTYNAGYNHIQPFGPAGHYDVDKNTGLITLFPPTVGSFVVGMKVTEYRNGVKIGESIQLDLQILVVKCPPNNPPKVSSSQGYEFEIEAGEELCFNITVDDPDGDEVQISGSGEILEGDEGFTGPTGTLPTKRGMGSVTQEFCWNTSCDQARAGPYYFFVEGIDDGCPARFDNKRFEIKVNPFKGVDRLSGPDPACSGNSNNWYLALDPAENSSFEWEVTNGTILSSTDSNAVEVSWDENFTNGSLRVRETSQYGCPDEWVEMDITILASPDPPSITGDDTVCYNGGTANYQANAPAGSVVGFTWVGATLVNQTANSIEVNWNDTGNFRIGSFLTNANGCVSDTIYFDVFVYEPLPVLEGPRSVCPNSQNIAYHANGMLTGSTFQWEVVGGTIASGQGTDTLKVNWGELGPGLVRVTETTRHGCISPVVALVIDKTYNLDVEDIIGDTSVCEFDENVPYLVVNSTGSVYDWDIDGGNQNSGDSSNSITINWGAEGNARVGIRQRAMDYVNNTQCISNWEYIDVVIHPLPDANLIDGPDEACQFEGPFSYTVNGFANSTFEWWIDGNPNNINGQGTNSIEINWDTPGTFELAVLETSEFGCPGDTIKRSITVHPKPISNQILGPDVLCQNEYNGIAFGVLGYPNSTFNWAIANGTIVSGQGTDSIVANFIVGETNAAVAVQEISEFGCEGDSIVKNIVLDNLVIDLRAVSVGLPDNFIELRWETEENTTASSNFSVWRRVYNSGIYNEVGSVDNATFYYPDQPLNTDNNAFDYFVSAFNKCGDTITSETHTNVWLSGYKSEDDYSIVIDFTDYFGWDNLPSGYEIYRMLPGRTNYEFYDYYNSPTEVTYNTGLDYPHQCFRIKAVEAGGDDETAWSNEQCYVFDPVVYVPNAFTPGIEKDNESLNINKDFNAVGGAVQTFQIKIYNRWGEQLFEANDMETGWDGTYKGKDAQSGVYFWVITFTDYNTKEFQMQGTVHLLR